VVGITSNKVQVLKNPDLQQIIKNKSPNPSDEVASKSNLKTTCLFVFHPTI
jgi:hypothetical protein